MAKDFDDILTFIAPVCFPELNYPCKVCGEPLYDINEKFKAQCVNPDCIEGTAVEDL